MRLRSVPQVFCCVLLVFLSGCGGEAPMVPASGAEELSIPAPMEFTLPCYPNASFHPLTGDHHTNLILAPLLYEGLFALDEQFMPVPVLCDSYEVSEDGMVWTIFLKPGIQFSDGVLLSASDAAQSLILAKSAASVYASRLSSLQSASPLGPLELELTLSAPHRSFHRLLDVPIVRGEGHRPAGTGPYALVGVENPVLSARPDWWGKTSLPVKQISLRALRERGDLMSQFETRGISLVEMDLSGTHEFGFSGGHEEWSYPAADMLYFGFNTRTGACSVRNVRKALSRMLDRTAIVNSALARHADPAAIPISPASLLFDAEYADALSYSSEEADRLLAAAGYEKQGDSYRKGRLGLSLTLLVNSENTHKVSVAEQFSEALRSFGIEVKLELLPFDEYVTALSRRKFDLFLGEVRLRPDFDLTPLLRAGGALNYGGFSSAYCDALLSAYLAAPMSDQAAAAAKLHAYISEEAPILPVCFKRRSVLTPRGYIKNLSPVQGNVFLGFQNWVFP